LRGMPWKTSRNRKKGWYVISLGKKSSREETKTRSAKQKKKKKNNWMIKEKSVELLEQKVKEPGFMV